jgi:5-oxoprolinase (ATP-hydrolysing) subunit A
MKKIDINCDMGESFGAWTMGMDGEVIQYVTSANIACGYHAGDAHVMHKTVKLAKEHGVGIGAHPGYPDLVGFGRRNMDCTPDEVRDYVAYQIGAMKAFCAIHGVPLQHVKPHGSLYNMSVGNEAMIRAIVEAIAGVDENVIYLALGGAQAPIVTKIAREAGIRVAFEAFPDRAYTPEGKLAPRSTAGAVIKDPKVAAERALRMAKEGKIITTDGSVLSMQIDTICVHGDNPSAVELVKQIRKDIKAEGISVVPMSQFVT